MKPGTGSPCSWTTTRRPATPSSSSRSRTSAIDSDAGDQDSLSPAARIAPRTLGPRASSSTRRSRASRVSPSPQPSAASIQPRKPIAVVATTTSGPRSSSRSVAASSSVSSGSGTIRSAGARMTTAPRRSRRAHSSSARRAAVTPTVKPARGRMSVCRTCMGSCLAPPEVHVHRRPEPEPEPSRVPGSRAPLRAWSQAPVTASVHLCFPAVTRFSPPAPRRGRTAARPRPRPPGPEPGRACAGTRPR